MAKRPTVLNLGESGPSKMIKVSKPVENMCEISSTSQSVKPENNILNDENQEVQKVQDTEEKMKRLIEEIGNNFVVYQARLKSATEAKQLLYGSAALQLFIRRVLMRNPLTRDEDIQSVATYLGLHNKGVNEYLDEMYPKRCMFCTSRYC